MSFDKLKAVKFVATGIVGMGTSKIVGRIIKNNVTPETLIEKVTVTAAAFVISGLITKATKNQTDEMIDDTIGIVTKVVDKVKTAEKLNRINKGKSTFEDEKLDPTNFIQDKSGRWVQMAVSVDVGEDELTDPVDDVEN